MDPVSWAIVILGLGIVYFSFAAPSGKNGKTAPNKAQKPVPPRSANKQLANFRRDKMRTMAIKRGRIYGDPTEFEDHPII